MAEPAQRRDSPDGGKFYEHLSRTEEVPGEGGSIVVRPARYTSVTTALSIKEKDGLKYWSANLAAARAVDNLPELMAAVLVQDCGRAWARTEPLGCGSCLPCRQRWLALFHVGESARRAREGTAMHDVLERWIATGEWLYTPAFTGDPDVDQYVPTAEVMAPYIQRLQEWAADYGLTPDDFLASECTVWNHRLKCAGTLDFIVDIHPRTKAAAELCARINHSQALTVYEAVGQAADVDLTRPVRILGDAKSRENEDAAIYSEYTLQLTGYRFAETMTPKHAAPEMEQPMLATDAAAVLQVRPDGYTFRPLTTSGAEMRAFEHALELYRWESERGSESTLVRAFPKPDGWKWSAPKAPAGPPPEMLAEAAEAPKPVKKAAPRKRAAAKKATPAAASGAGARVGGSPTLDSMRQRHTGARADIDSDAIPF
jgi:hypothetical protein